MNMFRKTMPLLAFMLFTLGQATDLGADENQWHHGGTLFGTLKYGRDFDHYDHVNVNAPKGGTLNQSAMGGFDSFNPFVVRGRPAAG